NIAIDNQDSVVVVDRRHSDVSRTLTNFDLYSSNSIRLIGVNLDGVVDENTDEGNGVISDLSNIFIAENQIYNDKDTLMELFKIRKYCAEHTCSVRDRVYARRQGITDVVAILIIDKFIDPSTVYTPKDIAEDVLKVHDVALTYMQAWRAKEKAIKLLLMGAALRGSYGGTMLTASTIDPGGHILPFAYAIVDSENDASWTWFFEQFREAYGERENMNTEDLKKLFFTMAKAYTIQQFEAIMQRIDQIDPRIRDYLYDIGYIKWMARRLPVISLLEFMRVIPSTVHMHVVVDGPKRLKNFQDTYAIPVEPLPCESTWDIPSYVSEPKLMPPGPKRTTGRPQLERWKGFADVKFKRSKVTCSRCRQVGHNRTTCSNYPVQKK
ncbi:hypothetical protein KY285_010375, partial [Solanum tuberosum]